MSSRLSIAGVALGLWLLTLILVGGCGLGQPAPTPTAAPPTPAPTSAAAQTSPTTRPASASPSPSPSAVPNTRRPSWTTNTALLVVDPDKGTADAGVRLRSKPSLGEDDQAVTLYDGDEVRLINASPERVTSAAGKEFFLWQVQVEKGDQSVVGKRGWVADDFLKVK